MDPPIPTLQLYFVQLPGFFSAPDFQTFAEHPTLTLPLLLPLLHAEIKDHPSSTQSQNAT